MAGHHACELCGCEAAPELPAWGFGPAPLEFCTVTQGGAVWYLRNGWMFGERQTLAHLGLFSMFRPRRFWAAGEWH